MDFSAEREVRALAWARRLIEARATYDHGEEFHAVEEEIFVSLSDMRDPHDEYRALVHALARFSSVLALSAYLHGETREEVIARVYLSLAQSSVEEEPEEMTPAV